MNTWVEIDPEKPLQAGDTIKLHYRTVGGVYVKAAQLAIIEYTVRNNELFSIINTEDTEKNKIIFQVRVKKSNPVVVTALVITAAICFSSIAVTFVLEKVEQLVESPGGQVAAAGLGGLGVAAAAMAIAFLFGRKR